MTDRILMLEHAVYSVITPEGCAAILWRSAEYRDKAAVALGLTSRHLKRLGVADEVVPEPTGGAHANPSLASEHLKEAIVRHLDELDRLETDELLERRWAKYAAIGAWRE